MKETKKMLRLYTADRYEKEEEFLTQMSQNGWHFVEFRGLIYFFEKGKPTNYIYKLDYKSDRLEDKSNYKAIYEDCGWDNIFEFPIFQGAWEYFRKESSCVQDGDDLFSDNESKIDLLTRIRRLYTTIGLFLIAINGVHFHTMFFSSYFYTNPREFLMRIFLFLFPILVIALYLKMYISLSLKIKKLKRI